MIGEEEYVVERIYPKMDLLVKLQWFIFTPLAILFPASLVAFYSLMATGVKQDEVTKHAAFFPIFIAAALLMSACLWWMNQMHQRSIKAMSLALHKSGISVTFHRVLRPPKTIECRYEDISEIYYGAKSTLVKVAAYKAAHLLKRQLTIVCKYEGKIEFSLADMYFEAHSLKHFIEVCSSRIPNPDQFS